MTALMDELATQLKGKKSKKKAPRTWTLPILGDLQQNRTVLAFDASLSNVGWVLLWIVHGQVLVMAKGTIKPKTRLTGFLESWDKAEILLGELKDLAYHFASAEYIAVEAPSVGGGHRTESSLIAGLMVWLNSLSFKRRAVVATHVSAVMLGNARIPTEHRKQAVREALARYIPGSEGRSWNEHERDAALIALTVLWDEANR